MVYKTVILNSIVKYDDNEEKIQFNHALMNEDQRSLFVHYKKEIVKEALIVETCSVKIDENVMKSISNEIVELDISKLNSRQKFLIDCCIKELEKKTNPDVYNEHKMQLKRKRNNECASKFREKRRKIEKVNEIIKEHLKEIFREHVKGLDKENIDKIQRFLMENNLINSLNYLNNYKKRFEASGIAASTSTGSEASYVDDEDKSYTTSNDHTNMSDTCSSVSEEDKKPIIIENSKVENECDNSLKSFRALNFKKLAVQQYENSLKNQTNNNLATTATTTTTPTTTTASATNVNFLNSTQKQAIFNTVPSQYFALNQNQAVVPIILIPSFTSSDVYNLMFQSPNIFNPSNTNSKILIS